MKKKLLATLLALTATAAYTIGLAACNTNDSDNKNPPHEHNYTEQVVAPTCTAQGYTLHICSRCGDTYKDNNTATIPHKYKDSVIQPTCNAQGYTTHTCQICNYNYTDNYIEAVPTNHSYTEAIIAPTCTKQGYTLHNCKICGDTYKDNFTELDFSNHKYKNGICINCNDIQETENLAYTLNSDGISYTLYGIGTAYDALYIKIPSSYNGKPVTAIRNGAFLSFSSIKQVIIPEGITSIGNSAFKGCTSLEKIIIPDSVTYIGQQAFYNCTNPYLIQTESDGVQYIDKWVVGCGRNATHISLRENTRGIADEGLAYCSKITDIYMPDSIIAFGYCSFYLCRSLKNIIFSGTTEQWNKIIKDPSWVSSTGDYTVHCTDGEIAKDGTVTMY